MSPFTVAPPPTLLLDTLSATALFAISSRKLRSAYAGKALQIQSGTDVGFTGGGDLDTSGLSGTNSIARWYDQVGANDSFNATSAQQPIIQNSGVLVTQNGHVWAAGTSSNGLPNALVRASPYTIAVLAKLDGSPAGGSILGTQFAGNHVFLGSSGGSAWFGGNSSNVATGGSADNNVHTIIVVFDTSLIQIFVDGASVASTATTFESMSGGFDLWDFGGNGAHIGECLVFAGVLSGPDKALIKASWVSYWNAPP